MYTVCYILADNAKLLYYNQLLISLSSLRKREYIGKVFVVMDTKTAITLQEKNRQELSEFNAQPIIVYIPDEYSQKEKSRYLKTSLREYLEGDFLYIDTDTVIADALPNEITDAELALVSDGNKSKKNAYGTSSYRENLCHKCGYALVPEYEYYNSGVIWARDSEKTHAFFSEWHKEWKHCRSCGVIQDQPSLYYVNSKQGGVISELDGKWNVQICCLMSLQFLNISLIIHYYNSPWESMRAIYQLSNPEIQLKGYRSTEVQAIIDSPKDALVPATFFRLDDVTEEVMYCKAFYVLKNMYINHKWLYRGINAFLSIPMWIKKKIKSK